MARSDDAGDLLAAALDLGSTRIKGGLLHGSGRLVGLRSTPSPPLRGSGPIREADPEAYLAAALGLAKDLLASAPRRLPLGLTSQRSSFTLWDRETGRHRVPLISWQDRRAAGWCGRNASAGAEVARISGLTLSAHYAGPKIAAMREEDPRLAADLDSGALLFGNLDAYLVSRWTRGGVHETDLTMAARSAAVDLARSDWSDSLLRRFGLPRTAVPAIVPGRGRSVELEWGAVLEASVADQSSSALSALDPSGDAALVNLGTGGFVLVPAKDANERRAGYLTAPILGDPTGRPEFVLEGSINGAGSALDRYRRSDAALPTADPAPTAFAVPDLAGVGSPHWRADVESSLSEAARSLAEPDRRRIVLEGLLFRIREILEGLHPGSPPQRVLLSGGLAREPAVGSGLAALLNRPIEVLEEREGTLLGVARLAAGLEPMAPPRSRTLEPGASGAYLAEKYERWRHWFDRLLSAGPGS